MIPATYHPFFISQNIDHSPVLFQRLARASQFHLLKAISDQKGHAFAIKLCTHDVIFFYR
ncbi:hypothetical protein D3C78_1794700 [compost metagenome]